LFYPIVSTATFTIYLVAKLGWTYSKYLIVYLTSGAYVACYLGIIFFSGDSGSFIFLISLLITYLCSIIYTFLVFESILDTYSKTCFVC